MKNPVTSRLVFLICLAFSFHSMAGDSDPYAQYTEESRKIAQEFMQNLAGTLKQQLETSGTSAAIKVCKEVAPALAAQYSTENRLVKRVSLKPRNQLLGVPSDVERDALETFDSKHSSGQSGLMELGTVYEDAGGKWFHFMRAIPTQPQCLQCHGGSADISTDIQTLLSAEYPEDQATGYKAGEIRGAISIRHRIQ